MSQTKQTWLFKNPVYIVSTATVGGTMEQKSPYAKNFDYLFTSNYAGQTSFEQAEQALIEKACLLATQKAQWKLNEIDVFIAGDLLNQITSSSFTARNLNIPYLGIFSACSTSMQGLALAAQLVSSGASSSALTATVSHNCTAERQFRYPTEYGAQKPPYSQYTATAAGAALVSTSRHPVQITSATIGKVIDFNVTDPLNMGAAMAPAAVSTIRNHLNERGLKANYYDRIITGDLGKVGYDIASDLLKKDGISLNKEQFMDCGCLLYGDQKNVFSGGSGCGCAASMVYGHFVKELQEGNLQRVLVATTGALHSPMSVHQNKSILCISHAVSLERGDF
ncbi:MAG: stage V sporulation protein AD [Bacillota bacterium]